MQLICLNAWGGRAHDALADFILHHRQDTDVFCFQEILTGGRADQAAGADAPRPGLCEDLGRLLREFAPFFTPMKRRTSPGPGAGEYGLATFVRRTITVVEAGHVPLVASDPGPAFVWEGWESLAVRPLQYCSLLVGGRELHVANFHGTPDPPDKLDTPERLEQSRRILDVAATWSGDAILAGDFNLLPDTASIGLLSGRFRNLVREHAIPTTRSRLNPHHGTPQEQKFADYVFVSPRIQVRAFAAPDVLVSDHLPLILSFE